MRLMFAIAAEGNHELVNFDEKTAFLYGKLTEDVYMNIPEGYSNTNMVCKLNRALYGFKQAPMMWNERFSGFLKEIGDCESRRSTTGYVILYSGGPVSWCTRKQPIVALSTTEAEYVAAADCCKEVIYLKSFIEELLSEVTATLNIDNKSKAFCVGPATFGKLIAGLQLTGSVIQTHVNCPRTVAYLATILSQNGNIKKLMAFNAGNRKKEYEHYFRELGMKNILIYSEKLIDISPDAHCLEEAIAVFATPPNSYSAVTDPIDLVCGRGGDLSMLEILTESEETSQTRERVASILEEQRKTLRFAMSRPQIQFVLYETHSELDAENVNMVDRAMKEINRIAKIHHATLQGKIDAHQQEVIPTEIIEINNNQPVEKGDPMLGADATDSTLTLPSNQISSTSVEETNFDEKFQDVVVPDCDVFETPSVPNLCTNLKKCTSLKKEGCYLALLQRKVVTNMDNKYMIQMAEERGLFGSTAQSTSKRSVKTPKTKKTERLPSPTQKPKKIAKQIEVERIAAPTMASMNHAKVSMLDVNQNCPKYCSREETTQSRKWWCETTRHLNNLRTSLVKQKILPPLENRRNSKPTVKNIVHTFVHSTQRIDEIVVRNSKNANIPVFPKLRLTRKPAKKDKVPCPITSGSDTLTKKEELIIENTNNNQTRGRDMDKYAVIFNTSAPTSRSSASENTKRKSPVVARLSIPTYNSIVRKVSQQNVKVECVQCLKRNGH
ncbi:hypothetical protein Trydic_g12581 [Trypoxylus dichotomus]